MRIRHRIVWGLLVLAFLGLAGTIGGYYAAGYRAYIIHTGSMSPELVSGDLIIDRPAKDGYDVGDVITFRHGPTTDLVTHRITQITTDGIHTKGDANRTADVWTIPRSYVQGVVSWRLSGVGFAVAFLQQPTGIASIVIGIIGLILLWQLFFPATPTTESQLEEPADVAPEATREEPDGHLDDEPRATPADPEATVCDGNLELEPAHL